MADIKLGFVLGSIVKEPLNDVFESLETLNKDGNDYLTLDEVLNGTTKKD